MRAAGVEWGAYICGSCVMLELFVRGVLHSGHVLVVLVERPELYCLYLQQRSKEIASDDLY